MNLRLLILLLLVVLLAGCAHGKKVETQTVLVDKSVAYECGTPPAADPFTALSVTWTVQTLSTGLKVFTLTGAMYESLMTNMVNAASSGKQVKAQRDFYADCIARSGGMGTPAGMPPNPTTP